MKIEYSSAPSEEIIYTTVHLQEEKPQQGGSVEVGCWVRNSDSRTECAQATKQEAIRLLKLALAALET